MDNGTLRVENDGGLGLHWLDVGVEEHASFLVVVVIRLLYFYRQALPGFGREVQPARFAVKLPIGGADIGLDVSSMLGGEGGEDDAQVGVPQLRRAVA